MRRMVKGAALPGSPFSPAIFAPFGRTGGASPHFTSRGLVNVSPAPSAADASSAADSDSHASFDIEFLLLRTDYAQKPAPPASGNAEVRRRPPRAALRSRTRR